MGWMAQQDPKALPDQRDQQARKELLELPALRALRDQPGQRDRKEVLGLLAPQESLEVTVLMELRVLKGCSAQQDLLAQQAHKDR